MAKDALPGDPAKTPDTNTEEDVLKKSVSRFIPYHPGNPNDMQREQFFLNVEVERLFSSDADEEARRELIQEQLAKSLEKRDSWRNAYQAEQLLVGLMDVDKLVLEADRRLVEAEDQRVIGVPEYRAQLAEIKQNDYADENRLRNLVLSVVSDNQWKRTSRFLERKFAAAYVNRINFIWIVCTLCFLFSVFIIDLLPDRLFVQDRPAPVYVSPQAPDQTLIIDRGLTIQDASQLIQQKIDLPHLSGLWLALFTGLLGASFSMIAMAQKRLEKIALEELQLQSRWEFLLLRLGFGSGAAVILYFSFQARLIEGVLFPDLTQIGVLENNPKTGIPWGEWVPNANLAALMVWSFVAGFSENFVPNFLRRVEEPVTSKRGP